MINFYLIPYVLLGISQNQKRDILFLIRLKDIKFVSNLNFSPKMKNLQKFKAFTLFLKKTKGCRIEIFFYKRNIIFKT